MLLHVLIGTVDGRAERYDVVFAERDARAAQRGAVSGSPVEKGLDPEISPEISDLPVPFMNQVFCRDPCGIRIVDQHRIVCHSLIPEVNDYERHAQPPDHIRVFFKHLRAEQNHRS